jgi:hypothetical protein
VFYLQIWQYKRVTIRRSLWTRFIIVIGLLMGNTSASSADPTQKGAEIKMRESSEIEEFTGQLSSKTLLIFDIDNTLIRPASALGSDEWLFFLEELFRKKTPHLSSGDVLKKAEGIWNEVQWLVKVVPVDSSVPERIRTFQDAGVKIMGLTARISEAADVTESQLQSVGIDLNLNPVTSSEVTLPKEIFGTADSPLFRNGVLYIGETNVKGTVLERFLKENIRGSFPKNILYFDDKEKHIRSVAQASAGLKIENYTGVRYSKTDPIVGIFNERAKLALESLVSSPERFERVLIEAETFSTVPGFREALRQEYRNLFLTGELGPSLKEEVKARKEYWKKLKVCKSTVVK